MGFRSVVAEIALTDTDVFTMPATVQGAVVLHIGNVNAAARSWTLKFFKQATGATVTLASGVAIAGNASIKFAAPLAMQPGDKIVMSASHVSSIVVFATVTDSGASPAAQGFTPRGDYAGGATYARNDIVKTGGILYASTQDGNAGNTPASSPTFWVEFFDPSDISLGPAALLGKATSVGELFAPSPEVVATSVAIRAALSPTGLAIVSNQVAVNLANSRKFTLAVAGSAAIQLPTACAVGDEYEILATAGSSPVPSFASGHIGRDFLAGSLPAILTGSGQRTRMHFTVLAVSGTTATSVQVLLVAAG
jgi:hypothetical protein